MAHDEIHLQREEFQPLPEYKASMVTDIPRSILHFNSLQKTPIYNRLLLPISLTDIRHGKS